MTDRTHPDSGRIITSGDVIAELHDRIAGLEAQLESIGAGGVEPLRRSISRRHEDDAGSIDHHVRQAAEQTLDGNQEPFDKMGPDETWIDCNTEANARLISAAPELLAALQALVGWEDAEIKHFGATGPDDWIMEDARAAIAKATT